MLSFNNRSLDARANNANTLMMVWRYQSDDSGVRVRGDGVLHASHRVVLVGTEGHVVDAVVLQQDLHLPVLLLVMPTQHLQILRQLAHLQPQIAVFSHQIGIVPE